MWAWGCVYGGQGGLPAGIAPAAFPFCVRPTGSALWPLGRDRGERERDGAGALVLPDTSAAAGLCPLASRSRPPAATAPEPWKGPPQPVPPGGRLPQGPLWPDGLICPLSLPRPKSSSILGSPLGVGTRRGSGWWAWPHISLVTAGVQTAIGLAQARGWPRGPGRRLRSCLQCEAAVLPLRAPGCHRAADAAALHPKQTQERGDARPSGVERAATAPGARPLSQPTRFGKGSALRESQDHAG